MSFRFGHILTAREIQQHEHTLTEACSVITQHGLTACLGFIETLSRRHFMAMLRNEWKIAGVIEPFISEYVPPANRRFAVAAVRKEGFVAPVSAHGLLCFALLAVCKCRSEGSIASLTPQQSQVLFSVLLSLQGQVMGPVPEASEVSSRFAAINRHVLLEQRLQRNWSCDIGRLHAFLTVPEIEERLNNKFPGITMDKFFQNGFGLSGSEFQVAANTTFGAIIKNADFRRITDAPPKIAAIISALLSYIQTEPEELAAKAGGFRNVEELAAKAGLLLSTPAIWISGRHYIPNVDALFNRLIRDLPHLSWTSRQRTDSQCPVWFGTIFEGYVTWFLKQIIKHSDVEIISPYYVDGSERDILLRLGGTVVPIEVKATVPIRNEALIGEWDELVANLKRGTEQVFHAAQGLLEGKARDEQGAPIEKPSLAIPLSVTFDPYPLRFPVAKEFEKLMDLETRRSIFNKYRTGIAPIQYLDVQQLELLDIYFNFPSEAGRFFDALKHRAYDEKVRHGPWYSFLEERTNLEKGFMNRMAKASEESSSSTLERLQRVL